MTILTYLQTGAVILALLQTSLCQVLRETEGRLPSFNVFDKRVTLSGFSSGGTFAQMFHISHSSLIHGIGVFSHSYYRCGRPSEDYMDYDAVCTKLAPNMTEDQLYNPEFVHKDIKEYLANGWIDDVANLKDKGLYVYAGLNNFLFTPAQSLGVLTVFERYIRNPSRIMTRVQDAQLILPTNNPNTRLGCKATTEEVTAAGSTFVGNCGLNGPFEALSFLVGPEYRVIQPPAQTNPLMGQRLRSFDQTEFLTGLTNHNMDKLGYFYIPEQCYKKACLLHFYFHGCFTGRADVGPKHIVESGYLEIAAYNDIIMIFPQAAPSPKNDIGCWDTFGLGGPLYATKKGDQIIAVKRMYDRAVMGVKKLGNSGTVSKPNYNWWGQHKLGPHIDAMKARYRAEGRHRYRGYRRRGHGQKPSHIHSPSYGTEWYKG